MLPYGLIVLVASIALVVYFDFVTEASWINKAVVSVLFLFTFTPFIYSWTHSTLPLGLFLRVAVGIYIIFYWKWQAAKLGK
jgi:hypothetical protein